MDGNKGGKMQGNLPDDRKLAEIERLEHTANYYDRLGCVDVARSLRRLAAAKRKDSRAKDRNGS